MTLSFMDDGIDRLDGITMMLIAMGEQIKRLDDTLGIDIRLVACWILGLIRCPMGPSISMRSLSN